MLAWLEELVYGALDEFRAGWRRNRTETVAMGLLVLVCFTALGLVVYAVAP